MKHERWLTLLCGTLLAFLLSFSCAFCIATGFHLHTDGLVDLRQLALWCAFLSLFCSACDTFRFGGVFVFAVLAAVGAYLWFYGALEQSVEALCETITTRYHNGYRWGILRWSGADLQVVDRIFSGQLILLWHVVFFDLLSHRHRYHQHLFPRYHELKAWLRFLIHQYLHWHTG